MTITREQGYAIEGGPEPKPAEDSPERLRERREALGLSRRGMAVIVQRHETGDVHWEPEDIRICEIPANPPHRASGRATYAAALSAAEAERADKPAGVKIWPLPLDHAPEVVDVPQPIVKRCACPDVHDDVEAEWRPGEPYLTVTHTTIPLALLRAMLEAIDAQQGGAS